MFIYGKIVQSGAVVYKGASQCSVTYSKTDVELRQISLKQDYIMTHLREVLNVQWFGLAIYNTIITYSVSYTYLI